MSRAILGRDIGRLFIEKLGLPKRTRNFKIDFPLDGIVTVECEYFPDGEGVRQSAELLTAKYELREKGAGE